MPISFDDFQKQYSAVANDPVEPIRREFGWMDRLGASADRFQSQLYGVGEAMGLDLAEQRRANQVAGEYARQRAIQDTGAPESLGETFSGLGQFAKGVGGLFVDSAPELATSLAAFPIGGALGLGATGRAALGAAMNYPSAVGDILQNQRDEAGQTRLGVASALGVPYAAVDALGLEGALASGRMLRTGIDALDNIKGWKGGLARTGANAGLNAAVEGSTETFQEGVNQFGRMSVNPEQTFINDESLAKFGESFGAGALMGGSASALMGGWRRSDGYLPPGQNVDNPEKPADLLSTGSIETTEQRQYPVALRDDYLPRAPLVDTVDPTVETPVSFAQDPLGLPAPASRAPVDPNTLVITPAGTVARMGALTGQQYDMFGGPDTFGEAPAAPVEDQLQPRPDTQTRDMFAETPTAMVQTMFNPERASSPLDSSFASEEKVEGNAPKGQRTAPSRGAIFGTISSNIASRLGKPTTYGVKLANELAQVFQTNSDPASIAAAMESILLANEDVQAKEKAKINRKVDRGSDMLSPEEYTAEIDKIEEKELAILAARDVVNQFKSAYVGALAQEGRAKARPGRTVNNTQPAGSGTEQTMRDNSMAAAVAETDARGQQSRAASSAQQRMEILRDVLAQPTRNNPVARFRKALRDAGFTNLDITPDEQAEVDRVSQRRDDVRAATVLPPGLAAAQGRLTARSSLNEQPQAQPAAQPVQPAAAPDAPVAAAPVAPAKPAKTAAKATRPAASPTPAPVAAPATQPVSQPAETAVAEEPQAVTADEVFEEVRTLRERRQSLLSKNGRAPNEGSAKGDEWDALTELIQRKTAEWAELDSRERRGTAPQKRAAKEEVRNSEQSRKEMETVAKAAPKRAPREVAMGQPVETLFDMVDNAKDDVLYNGAVDALYRRFMESEVDSETDAILEYVESQGKAFNKDWQAAEKRYDDTERGVKGKRGFSQTKDAPTSEQIRKSAEADILRGVWARFRQAAKRVGGKPSLAAIRAAVQQVQKAASFSLPITIVDNPASLGVSVPGGGNPPGVFTQGRIYLFSDNISSMSDVWFTIFHELFHLGLSKTVKPEQYHALMRSFINDPVLAPMVEKWKASPEGKARQSQMAQRDYNALAVEESLAELSEKLSTGDGFGSAKAPMVRALLRWFSKLADAVGMGGYAQQLRRMTLTEAEAFVSDTMQAIMGAAGNPFIPVRSGGTKFSQGRDVALGKFLDGVRATANTIDQRLPKKGDVLTFKSSYAGREGQTFVVNRLGEYRGRPVVWGEVLNADGTTNMGDSAYTVSEDGRTFTYTGETRFFLDAFNQTAGLNLKFRQANTERELNDMERESGTPKAFTDKWKSTSMGYLVRNLASGWRGKPWLLGFLTLDQIKDRFSDFGNVKQAVDTWLKMGSRATEIMRLPSTLHKQWATLTRKDRAAAERLNRLLIDATIAEAWVDGDGDPRLDPRNKHLDFNDPEVSKAVAAARSLFVSLPKEAQQLYRDVTSELTSQFRMKQDAMLKRVVDVYKDGLSGVLSADEMMSLAKTGKLERATAAQDFKPNMTPAQRIELQRFYLAVDSAYIPTNQVPGPYFPLTRRGSHVVVFKSDAFKVAEKRLDDARKAMDDLLSQDLPADDESLKAYDAQVKAAKEAVKVAKQALEVSKGRSADYEVEFHDGLAQAQDAREAMAKRKGVPLSALPKVIVRQEFTPRSDSLPAGFMSKLVDQMNKELPDATREEVTSIVRQLVIQSMPEKSAFKSELRRMGTAGAKPEDAMFSFVSASHRNAWTISRLENISELSQAMNLARSSEDQDERLVGNELTKRYANSMTYDAGNPLLDMASNLSYITHLGFSVGYYVQNMTQPWLVSMPVMASRFGFRATNKALADATVEVVKAMHQTIKQGKTKNNWEMPLDLGMFADADERQMLDIMTNTGRVDITIRADLGVGTTTAENAVGHVLQRAAELSSLPAHQVEVVNRVATALAAFRLAKRQDMSFNDALAYADKVVVQTHVDYSMENAPRFMNPRAMGGLGRLTFQFRRYQQAMVFLWGKTVLDAIRNGDKGSARALMYLSGTNLAMAGASGLPLAAPMGLVMAAFSQLGDEDEERDLNEMFWAGVKGVVGDTLGDLARKGIPASLGVDISQRVGSGNILSPVFNMPQGQTGQEWAGAWALQLFGAAGGTAANWADAVMLSQNNPAMAIQKTLPAGIRAWFQAVDREQRGLTDRKGNVLIGEDELGTTDFLTKFLNLGESTTVTNMYQQRNAVIEADKGRQDTRSRLMREYTRARLDGDTELVAETRKEIDAFNARNPAQVRILPKNLTASYKQEQTRQKELRTGIRVNDRNRDIAEDYGVTQ